MMKFLLLLFALGALACNQQAETRSAPADSATIKAAIDSAAAVYGNAAAAIDSTVEAALDSTKPAAADSVSN